MKINTHRITGLAHFQGHWSCLTKWKTEQISSACKCLTTPEFLIHEGKKKEEKKGMYEAGALAQQYST